MTHASTAHTMRLFRKPDPHLHARIEQIMTLLQHAMRMRRDHLADLPYAIADLSRLLTQERAAMQSYWASPRNMAAYLRYFLPWNIIRLAWLLPQLPVKLPNTMRMLDLGSGPLTVPISMAIAWPNMAQRHVELLCTDISPHPMQIGKNILTEVLHSCCSPSDTVSSTPLDGDTEGYAASSAPCQNNTPWSIRTYRAGLDTALRASGGGVHLLTAGNVLNELKDSRTDSIHHRLESFVAALEPTLAPGGYALFVEPGTRQGGRLISLLRTLALSYGFTVEAPCPHTCACPYYYGEDAPEDDEPYAGIYSPKRRDRSAWCHFSFSPEDAPTELVHLTQAAGLAKSSLSLSFLLLKKPLDTHTPPITRHSTAPLPTLVLSDVITIAGRQPARYVCGADGLGLLLNGRSYAIGEYVPVMPTPVGRDAKTGALFYHATGTSSSSRKTINRTHGPEVHRTPSGEQHRTPSRAAASKRTDAHATENHANKDLKIDGASTQPARSEKTRKESTSRKASSKKAAKRQPFWKKA